jgi:hypothetical protein
MRITLMRIRILLFRIQLPTSKKGSSRDSAAAGSKADKNIITKFRVADPDL